MTIIKLLNDNRNKMKRKKMLKSKRINETKREGQPKGQDSERTEKEGEEKNSSSTQAKWGRREKSSLTTQENFLVCQIVRDEDSIYRWEDWWKWKNGLMVFDGQLWWILKKEY